LNHSASIGRMMLTAPASSPDEAQQKHSADMLVFYLSK
jgi:hypothetical protein